MQEAERLSELEDQALALKREAEYGRADFKRWMKQYDPRRPDVRLTKFSRTT